MSTRRTVARSRVVGTVLAILLVTVAAVADRLSEPAREYELVAAPLDRSVAYGSGRITVSDVRIGDQVEQGTEEYRTRGLFVVVDVALQATGRDDVTVADSHLLTGSGVTYLPALSSDTVTAHPGFAASLDLVYEVDPARLDDLTLETWSSGLVYRYYQRTRTPLGVTAANAGRWAEAGKGRRVVVPGSAQTEALG